MSISPCPVCHEEVSLPANASPSAMVQCPLCREEYELSRVLDKMPPALVVISDNGSSEAGYDAPYGFASDRASGFSFGDAAESQANAPAFQFEQSAAPSASASAPSPASRATQPRRQKKQKSAVWEIAKVVGGGVIGIAGALLIMWWGLKKDPLDFGPSVYKVLPWIVPAQFSGVASNDDTANKSQEVADKNQSNTIDTKPKKLGTELDASVVPWGNEKKDDSKTSTDDDNGSGGSSSTKTDNKTKTTNKVVDEPVGIRNAGYVAASDVLGAMDDYKSAAGGWIAALADTDADRKQQADLAFYSSLARFGEIAAYADDTDPEVQAHTKTMVSYLGNLKSRNSDYGSLKFIADWSSNWLAAPADRANEGIMLAGTVLSVKPHGRIFESQVQLANESKESVTIFHLKKPAVDYVRKAQVLLLGVVVDKPTENLIGFEGSDPEVVVSAREIVHGVDDSLDASKPAVPDVPVPSIDIPSIKVPSIDFPSSTTPSIDTPSTKSSPDSPEDSSGGANSPAIDE